MKVVSDQDVRIALTSGAVVLLQAGVEREVSEEIGLHALQMGAKQATTKKEAEPLVEVVEAEEPNKVVAAMTDLIKEGDPENFKADGTPKAAVINKVVGRTVPTNERLAAWETALNS